MYEVPRLIQGLTLELVVEVFETIKWLLLPKVHYVVLEALMIYLVVLFVAR